ncbi:hypothetical protein [cf. Phormidesmis sp. LEGE 11477]|uniref:hypothetical protein n=1 Tax=cf. Phormidesmis sp. LEGE 11477 TaxID=1828680 RepID=UPI00188269B7|nr:hypothetical protein [cf. Phormidesmis sp. LEGE 11477]MBE9060753.1 hypothetical protein [cf. Phormidesmis sp. LEGE 11477]
MDIRLLRQFWSILEASRSQRLASLDDSSLSKWILDILKADPTFDSRHLPTVDQYIQTRIPLIRDLAQQA